MQHITLHINTCGDRLAPIDWQLRERLKMQRIYFIKGGTAYYTKSDHTRVRFEVGKLYLSPFNLTDTFSHDPSDPINHIYFDFTSTPPIIAPEPLCIEIPEGSALRSQLDTIDRFFAEHPQPTIVFASQPLNGTPPGSEDEEREILYSLLHTLLLLLSREHPLPFADDAAVIGTLEIIRQNYAQKLTVSELAAQAGFEMNYFIRRFKAVMGVTPYAYLRSFRLMRASELVANGCTIAHAAELVGYDDASSLSRALRQLK